jgi:hypothetical protein
MVILNNGVGGGDADNSNKAPNLCLGDSQFDFWP